MNVRLDLEFDGTAYCGWQFQRDHPTVQGTLEQALARLFGSPVRVTGAGRTDAGVSALDYPVNFTAPRKLPRRTIRAALNQFLPQDIRVRRARSVAPAFHARFDARSKIYRYTIVGGRSPVLKRQAWELDYPVDRALMKQGARVFLGTHDFAPFCRLKKGRDFALRHPDGKVNVMRVRLLARRSAVAGRKLLQIEFEGDRFLYKMVRRMVGALVDVGRGKFPLSELRQAVQNRPQVQFSTAPARGLLLVRVKY